jgi:hypothetical protein
MSSGLLRRIQVSNLYLLNRLYSVQSVLNVKYLQAIHPILQAICPSPYRQYVQSQQAVCQVQTGTMSNPYRQYGQSLQTIYPVPTGSKTSLYRKYRRFLQAIWPVLQGNAVYVQTLQTVLKVKYLQVIHLILQDMFPIPVGSMSSPYKH